MFMWVWSFLCFYIYHIILKIFSLLSLRMSDEATAELQQKLDSQQQEVQAHKNSTVKDKVEFEARLKEESYEKKLLKF